MNVDAGKGGRSAAVTLLLIFIQEPKSRCCFHHSRAAVGANKVHHTVNRSVRHFIVSSVQMNPYRDVQKGVDKHLESFNLIVLYHSAVSHPSLSSLFTISSCFTTNPPRDLSHLSHIRMSDVPSSSFLRYLAFSSERCLETLHIKSHDTWKVLSACEETMNPDRRGLKVSYWCRCLVCEQYSFCKLKRVERRSVTDASPSRFKLRPGESREDCFGRLLSRRAHRAWHHDNRWIGEAQCSLSD